MISLGYRVNSSIAMRFRCWATACLKEYMIKGFTMDDERLKCTGGSNYWRECLERIREIHSSKRYCIDSCSIYMSRVLTMILIAKIQ